MRDGVRLGALDLRMASAHQPARRRRVYGLPARPLEDAFRIAQTGMVRWLDEDYGLEAMDALQLVTQGVLSPLANVGDTNYAPVAKFPKRYLPPGVAMGGADARLRDIAAEYRRLHP
jgi:hypothetical protein